jgi:hypothetical protein
MLTFEQLQVLDAIPIQLIKPDQEQMLLKAIEQKQPDITETLKRRGKRIIMNEHGVHVRQEQDSGVSVEAIRAD